MRGVRSRAKVFGSRLYFSRLVPRRLRDAHLDWHIRRASRTVLSHADPPRTFNDKVHYRMLHDRRSLLTTFADRYAVREYVQSKVGGDVLTELLLVTEDPDALRQEALPREFALKATHGCGGSVLVSDLFGQENELPPPPAGWFRATVPPDRLNWEHLKGMCRELLSRRYEPRLEWAYRNVPPRILVEELLLDDGSLPVDFKIFVFHGRARLVQVDSDRFDCHQRNFYSPTWEALPVEADFPRGPQIARPSTLQRMVSIAERLGEETDFVRVDLYSVAERIVFGELTNYPRRGNHRFNPTSFDRELGAWWTPPEHPTSKRQPTR